MTILIGDCETDNLLRDMTKLHCIQLGDADGDDSVLYGDHELCDRPLSEGVERMKAADKVVFHNGLGFDFFAIERFLPGALRLDQVLDTLVLARMTNITERDHSLDAWGRRTGTLKGSFRGPYDVFTPEFADYSRQDIPAGRALWHLVKHGLEWGDGSVYGVEWKAAYCCALQEQNGFAFDVAAAQALHGQLAEELAALKGQIAQHFPAFKRTEEFIPKVNNSKLGYVKGVSFLKKWDDEFNPRSRHHIAEALMNQGWDPVDFTPTNQPQVDERTLRSINHPGAKLLVTYLRTSKVLGAILGEKKSKGYLQLQRDGRIHGRVNTLGAVTWRMSHSNPNTANVDKDKRVRALFIATPGWKLVGCDGKEIQARFLAHYLEPYDGGDYAQKLLKGDKSKGTDGHTMNLKACEPFGLVSRDGAKTALYAKLFGARARRMLFTINEDRAAHDKETFAFNRKNLQRYGQGALDALGQSVVGLDDLLADVQDRGKAKGFLKGIGGAPVPVSAAHSALVSLLQHGEAVAMKWALGRFHFDRAPALGFEYGRDWRYCSNVHDEVQFEAPDAERAEILGDLFSSCIEEAGEALKMRCPLGGEKKVGVNWYETH